MKDNPEKFKQSINGKIVGLAGGLASGKDTVARHFAGLGIQGIDADVISRQLTADGNPAVADIIAHFGDDIAKGDLSLNRAKLRKIVFNDKQELQWLEKFLHPLIREQIKQQVTEITNAGSSPYCLLVAPLLLETGLYKLCDKIIVIDVLLEQQLKRAQLRDQAAGMTRDIAEKIIKRQLPQGDKLQLADYVLDNSGTEEQLQEQVVELHARILKDLRSN